MVLVCFTIKQVYYFRFTGSYRERHDVIQETINFMLELIFNFVRYRIGSGRRRAIEDLLVRCLQHGECVVMGHYTNVGW